MKSEQAGSTKVFVIDDHAIVRMGLRSVLEQFPSTDYVGEAADGRSALSALEGLARSGNLPDVVLMDIVMPELDGITVTARIRQRYPSVEVVVLTNYSEIERIHGALLAGAAGYVLKGSDIDDIAIAITSAHRGKVHLDAVVARRLMLYVRDHDAGPPTPLTPREQQVLIMIAKGRSSKEIAAELGISDRTVQTHTGNLLAKLHVTSRTQAALIAVRQGLVDPES